MKLGGWIVAPVRGVRWALLWLAANRARGRGAFADAADLYAQLFDLDPSRWNVRVQMANMLKDSGRFEEAEAAYRLALLQRPLEGDTHLQLGHLLKTVGRRSEAMDFYRKAASLSPQRLDANRTLALLGDWDAQEAGFDVATEHDGLASLIAFTAEVCGDQVSNGDDIITQLAFPVSRYHALRRLWDVPGPPPGGVGRPISVVVEMDNLSLENLEGAVVSLQGQSLVRFEAMLVGVEPARRRWAERVAEADPRFWSLDPANLAQLVESANYDTVLIPAPGATLHRHALAWVDRAFDVTVAQAFVCDAEFTDEAGRLHPELRPTVDYEILLQSNPYGETVALDRRRCSAWLQTVRNMTGHEAVLTLLLEVAAANAVGAIPLPLVASSSAGPRSELGAANYAEIVRLHLKRRGLLDRVDIVAGDVAGARVRWRRRGDAAAINVVIPTRDNGRDARDFVRSLRGLAAEPGRLRLTVIDNGTVDPASVRALAELAGEGVDVFRSETPFNWSRLSNIGAARAPADIVVFANDDMTMLTPSWDNLLQGLLNRPSVGVVGAKLLYPDETIQHASVLFGWGDRAIHDGLYEHRYAPGPGGRWQVRRRVSAVTGAFFAMRKPLFEEMGGFDAERLAIAYSDLDMALKVRRKGLAVLYAPEIELTHFESKSRGLAHLNESTKSVDEAELAAIKARWPNEFAEDITVNPMWRAATLPFRLLSPPTVDRATARLIASAAPDPWLPEAPRALV